MGHTWGLNCTRSLAPGLLFVVEGIFSEHRLESGLVVGRWVGDE